MADDKEMKPEKQEKTIMLKQYLVAGSPSGAKTVRKMAMILHTCPKNANDEFRRRFPGFDVWGTRVAAESSLEKSDLSRDLWSEGRNWILLDRETDESPASLF